MTKYQHADPFHYARQYGDLVRQIRDMQRRIGILYGRDPSGFDPSDIEADILDLQGDVSSLQGDITTLQGDVSALQNAITDLESYRTRAVRKSADETVTSSTALQDDNHLFMSVAANTTYKVEVYLRYAAEGTSAGGRIIMGWSAPSGATLDWWGNGHLDSMGNNTYVARATAGLSLTANPGSGGRGAFGSGVGADVFINPRGTLVTGGTAGTLTFRWAQANSRTVGTIVRAGSALYLTKCVV